MRYPMLAGILQVEALHSALLHAWQSSEARLVTFRVDDSHPVSCTAQFIGGRVARLVAASPASHPRAAPFFWGRLAAGADQQLSPGVAAGSVAAAGSRSHRSVAAAATSWRAAGRQRRRSVLARSHAGGDGLGRHLGQGGSACTHRELRRRSEMSWWGAPYCSWPHRFWPPLFGVKPVLVAEKHTHEGRQRTARHRRTNADNSHLEQAMSAQRQAKVPGTKASGARLPAVRTLTCCQSEQCTKRMPARVAWKRGRGRRITWGGWRQRGDGGALGDDFGRGRHRHTPDGSDRCASRRGGAALYFGRQAQCS